MQNHKYDSLQLSALYRVYNSFCTYYQGNQAKAVAAWRTLGQESATQELCNHPDYWKGIHLLEQVEFHVSEEDIFEFNRLFIGPDKLLAPPYEGAYRNPDGLLFQQETMEVRGFYKTVGLAVRDQNIYPDDRLDLELEFICYLIARAGQMTLIRHEQSLFFWELYQDFYCKHLESWGLQHCKDILIHAKTSICRGMALIMQGFLASEKQRITI